MPEVLQVHATRFFTGRKQADVPAITEDRAVKKFGVNIEMEDHTGAATSKSGFGRGL